MVLLLICHHMHAPTHSSLVKFSLVFSLSSVAFLVNAATVYKTPPGPSMAPAALHCLSYLMLFAKDLADGLSNMGRLNNPQPFRHSGALTPTLRHHTGLEPQATDLTEPLVQMVHCPQLPG